MAESEITAWIRKNVTKEVVIAFLLGAIVGLVVLGWWLWPVKWTNADPADLRQSHQESYLQMIADSYALTGNAELARTRLEALKVPGEKDTALAAILDSLMKDRLEAGKADEALRLQRLSSAVILPPPPTPAPTAGQPTVTTRTQALRVLGIAFFLLLLGAGIVLGLSQIQKRQGMRRRRMPITPEPFARGAEVGDITAPVPPESALGQLETTFNLGDQGYDVTVPIESSAGEFLGECGISALEDTSPGEPDRVAAFEVWLFDKDDVRTETKVLLSERAFADDALRERLATKGELIRVQQGQTVTLETANLRLDARIAEAEYESDANSAFARLTTRLEISAA
jgi:hypothetical protein